MSEFAYVTDGACDVASLLNTELIIMKVRMPPAHTLLGSGELSSCDYNLDHVTVAMASHMTFIDTLKFDIRSRKTNSSHMTLTCDHATVTVVT